MKPRDGFRRLFRIGDYTADVKRDVADEIGFYLEMRERELIARGVPPGEARRQARAAFGDTDRVAAEVESIETERVRRRHAMEVVESIVQDARFGVRALLRSPGFALAAIVTLAIGIGGNAMVFGLMEATLLRPPAVRSPETLAAVYTTCRAGDPRCTSSFPDYVDYQRRTRAFADLAAYTRRQLTLADGGDPELVPGDLVTGNFFSVLGVNPAEGRVLSVEDDAPGAPLVAVLSHRYWRARFGGDRAVIGRTVRLNNASHTVVGVAAPSFDGLRLGASPALWVPIRSFPELTSTGADVSIFDDRGSRWIQGLVARLADGASVESARAELLGVSRQLTAEDSAARWPRTVTVDPLPAYVLPAGSEQTISAFIWVLQGVVAFTLLLACANIANLLLARCLGRQRELAVRAAIGAGRGRIVRQLLTESLVLAAFGGAAGLALAAFALSVVSTFQLPFGFDIAALGAGVNGRVIAFTGVLGLVTVVFFGTLPALHVTRGDLASAVRAGRTGGGPRAGRLLGILVGIQVALCIALLAGAGLFLRTLRNHLRADLGFTADGVSVMTIDPSVGAFDANAKNALVRDLVARAAAIPGVEAASVGTRMPVFTPGSGFFLQVDGYTPAAGEEMRIELGSVAPDFFRTVGIQLLRGRDFTPADGPGAPGVMIVSERMARAWWPGRDPIGGTVRWRNNPYTVVGIARDVPGQGTGISRSPALWMPILQYNDALPRAVFVAARSAPSRVDGVTSQLRAVVREVDARIPVAGVTTMQRAISTNLAPQRGAAALLSVFAAIALVLASVGIYGVLAYTVAQRRRDFGIRMALGAPARALVSVVARGMGVPVAVGALLGLVMAAALGRSVSGLTFGVEPTDPMTLAAAVAILVLAAAIAMLGPARRAARTDPMEVMRAE